MTLIATKTLTAPRSTSKAVGTFYFRVLYDRDAGTDRTVVRIPDAVKLVDGKLPQLDFPPGAYEVRRDIKGLDPNLLTGWSKFVVPDTGTGPLTGGAFNLYDLIGMVTDYPAPIVSAAVVAKQAAEAAAAQAQQYAAQLQAVVAGAPTALDTLDELAAALGDDSNFAATVTTALNARPTKAAADAAYAAKGAAVSFAPAWQANTAYDGTWIVINNGSAYIGVNVPARSTFTVGDWTPIGGGGTTPASLGLVDNGDGTFSFTPTGGVSVLDNNDGTLTYSSFATDNGDGTLTLTT